MSGELGTPFGDGMYADAGGEMGWEQTDLYTTWHRRMQTDNDFIIVIAASSTTSMSGTGKTTLAIQLARLFDGTDGGFDAGECATLSSEEVAEELLPNIEQQSAIIFDEAQGTAQSEGTDSRRSMADEVLKMSRAAALYRYKQPTLIVVTQSARWIDSRMLDVLDRLILIKEVNPEQGYARGIVFDHWFDDLGSSRDDRVAAKEDVYWQPLPKDDPDYQTLHQLKIEAGKPDPDEEEDDSVSIAELAEQSIENGLGTYLSWHGGHYKWTLSTDRLKDANDITNAQAKRLKDHLVERSDIDLQEIGDEEKGRPV